MSRTRRAGLRARFARGMLEEYDEPAKCAPASKPCSEEN